jgi:hypothetical protein
VMRTIKTYPKSGRLLYCVIIPVAVEKLAHSEIAKIGSRQEALQTIFPSLLDIFYHPIFDFFQKNRVFQQPQGLSLRISFRDRCRAVHAGAPPTDYVCRDRSEITDCPAITRGITSRERCSTNWLTV